jgi:hypothetical protein
MSGELGSEPIDLLLLEGKSGSFEGAHDRFPSPSVKNIFIVVQKTITRVKSPLHCCVSGVFQTTLFHDVSMLLQIVPELLNVVGQVPHLRGRVCILVEESIIHNLRLTQCLDQVGHGEAWYSHLCGALPPTERVVDSSQDLISTS